MMNYQLCLLSLLIVGCSPTAKECTPKAALLYTNSMGGEGTPQCYEHFLVLDSYDDACFSRINFTALARSYVRASHSKGPICYVSFLRPDSKKFFDVSEPDLAGLATYQIIAFGMDSLTIQSLSIGAFGNQKKFQVSGNDLVEH